LPDLDAELAPRHAGADYRETAAGFKLKAWNVVFNRMPVGALEGSFSGIPG